MENTTDAEAPLLASYDGIEYASCGRPSKMLQGRASFKLKISQVCEMLLVAFLVLRMFFFPKTGRKINKQLACLHGKLGC